MELQRVGSFGGLQYHVKVAAWLKNGFTSNCNICVARNASIARREGAYSQVQCRLIAISVNCQDESGSAAMLTNTLDNQLGGLPVQFREIEGHESEEFLQVGNMAMLLGVSDRFVAVVVAKQNVAYIGHPCT